ncbi:signal peptidase complex subunit 2 [Nannochloropsis gaditana CCMP526]|uniref:signal peptidase complex subunit 2 n=1 Tax=Nannochloropsis gaditana (strain CCMP526) TaxID=1093141 RepID=UPI00029F5192|nr:signal peptidase complex subunit 2 [Nannochloropsis gaditana CCMP526]EKU22624.1 signal peptidase complex subunit 2 [Nannochloropsis gaditana CCMP526]|eukprot:XP_005853734.1 signal peptidase complex subunit 2 [Nannochloropsis gaditana CCMP526]
MAAPQVASSTPADEEEEPLHIDTGDQMKVKQVLDEAVVKAIVDAGYEENFFYDNIKLALMVIACVFALIAQFYPMPFPESRPLLGVCCLAYFLASTIIQLIVSYVEQDTILTTQPLRSGGKAGEALKVRTQFPRFQDEYTVFVEEAGMQDPPTVSSKFSIGKVFDEEGNFYEEGLAREVQRLLDRYKKQMWDVAEKEERKRKGGEKKKKK